MTDYNKWKVSDLKAELKKRALAQSGIKSVLIARLEEADNEEEASVDEAVPEEDINQEETKENLAESDDNSTVAKSPEIASPSSRDETLPDAPEEPKEPQQIPVTINTSQDTPSASNTPQHEESLTQEETDVHDDDDDHVLPPTNEDTNEDKKRKRSSHSPSPSISEMSMKRSRTSDNTSTDRIHPNSETNQKPDNPILEEKSNDTTKKCEETDEAMLEAGEPEPSGVGRIESKIDQEKEDKGEHLKEDQVDQPEPFHKLDDAANFEPTDSPKARRNSRFRGLFHNDHLNDDDTSYNHLEQERAVSPAIHPATTALYIRDMQRPLNPQQFRSHLSALAAPPGQSPDPDLIQTFYLDPIRTHAFISFSSIYAASRVRTALHSRVWPEERNRKPLWVDFVPEEKIEDWITHEQESNTGGRSMAKKWEVYYDVNEDRQVTASLQEASNAPLPAQLNPTSSLQPSSNHIPLGPRASIDGAPSGPRAQLSTSQSSFVDVSGSRLNELFNSTTIKPVLYWKPVSKELANKRLDCIEDSYSAEVKAGGRVVGDPHRYTFEEGDMLVDRGVELVPGLRPPPGYRAPRPGGDRGGFCGGVSSWGRGGSRYRGRGGGSTYRGVLNDKFSSHGNDSRGPRDHRRY